MSKIGIIVNSAWNIKNFRMGLIKSLIEDGHELVALTPQNHPTDFLTAAGAKVVILKNIEAKGKNPFAELRLLQEIRSIIESENIELCFNYTIKPVMYGTLAASKLNIPTINTITGLGHTFISKRWLDKIVNRVYLHSLKYSGHIVFQNKIDRDIFSSRSSFDQKNISIINGSGINPPHFAPSEEKQRTEGIVFLFVGRLLTEKGLVEYAEAAKLLKQKHPDAKIQVLGKMDEDHPKTIGSKMLNEWIDEGLIEFLGEVDDTRPYISNADVIVLPSYREGMPRVLLEAMAMAKPFITTDAPGCSEAVVDGINGFMVPVRNVPILAQTMQHTIEIGPEKRAELGRNGRKLAVDKYDERIIVNDYKRILDNLLK